MHRFVQLDPDNHPNTTYEFLARFPDAEVLTSLLHAGLERYEDLSWFELFCDQLGHQLGQRLRDTMTKDAALLAAALTAVEAVGDVAWQIDKHALRESLVDRLANAELDLNAAFLAVVAADPTAGVAFLDTQLAAALVARELLDPVRLVDRAQVRALESALDGGRRVASRSHDGRPQIWHEWRAQPGRLDYWYEVSPDRFVAVCVKLVETEPHETLGALARGVLISLSVDYNGPPEPIDLGPLARTLCRRRTEGGLDDRELSLACFKSARRLGDRAAAVLGEDHAALCAHALEQLGRMRTTFDVDDPDRFKREWSRLAYGNAFWMDTQPGRSLWDVLRRLILAFRSLPARAVISDLRTWRDLDREPLPEIWSWVPEEITSLLDRYIRRELELDKDLVELRRNLALFCLDRIKTRERKGTELVEPDPHWRCGYIHAARELHAALGERGHRVLVWSKLNDPEPTVREAAGLAEDIVRREQELPKNVTPRRAIYAAYWWLRQAHVLALAGHVDEKGSHETFRREIRRQPSHR